MTNSLTHGNKETKPGKSKRNKSGMIKWEAIQDISGGRRTTILVRLAGTIVVVMLFSVAINSLLNYFSFQKNYQQTIQSTFAAIVEELGFKIESSVNLGLPLASISNIPALLQQTAQYHEKVIYIVVRSPANRILFSYGSIPEGIKSTSSAPFTQPQLNDQANRLVYSDSGELSLITYRLVNSYEHVAGTLELGYDHSHVQHVQNKIQWVLLQEGAMVLSVFMVITFLLIFLTVYTFRQRLAKLEVYLTEMNQLPDIDTTISSRIDQIEHALEMNGKDKT